AIAPSRRDQSEDGAEATWTHASGETRLAFRGAWWKSQVRRSTLDFEEFDDKTSGWWLAARGTRPLGSLAADGSIGLGSQDGTGGLVVTPSLGLATGRRKWNANVRVERIATPIWTDRDPNTARFLQDTWTAALSLASGDSARHVGLTGRIGRTQHRALAERWPLEELWLRAGYFMDPDPYRFALASFEGAWGGRSWGTSLEAFALARSVSRLQYAVDPVNGVRASLSRGGHLFKNELDARLRLTAALVGARQSEATGAWFDPFVTFTAAGVFTLSDATVVIEGIGLENRPHPLTWIDPRTGEDALGPGLETRISFSWRLFN
ncbi:MAG: hypothetical protein L3K06_07385, partial [Thermoplasmata archaeon]|nr:hypothetical protein [Thermoplasmata archaeon]